MNVLTKTVARSLHEGSNAGRCSGWTVYGLSDEFTLYAFRALSRPTRVQTRLLNLVALFATGPENTIIIIISMTLLRASATVATRLGHYDAVINHGETVPSTTAVPTRHCSYFTRKYRIGCDHRCQQSRNKRLMTRAIQHVLDYMTRHVPLR